MEELTPEQQERYSEWSKDDIYEAYLAENKLRTKLNKDVNDLRRKIKEVEWNLKRLLKDSF